MSIDLMTTVWEGPYPPHEKLVMLVLADNANHVGEVAINLGWLVKKSSLPAEQVQAILKRLEDSGFLTFENWYLDELPIYRLSIPPGGILK